MEEQTKQNEQPTKTAEELEAERLEAEKKKAEQEKALAKKNIFTLNRCIERAYEKMRKEQEQSQDLAIKEVFNAHASTLMWWQTTWYWLTSDASLLWTTITGTCCASCSTTSMAVRLQKMYFPVVATSCTSI